MIGLLTPVIKGYGTDKGYDIATASASRFTAAMAISANGGWSSSSATPALRRFTKAPTASRPWTLVGRKLAMNGGRGLRAYLALLEQALSDAPEAVAFIRDPLRKASGELQAATMWLMQNGLAKPDNAGAAATPYMHLMGIVALGHMWLLMAKAALDADAADPAFREAKLVTARYFAERFIPDAGALRRKLEAGAEALMALPAEAF